jgi:Zn-finger nucleic acid-binding protein
MDNYNNINCPACGEEMVEIYVSSANKKVDVCLHGCGGIYFDNREYSTFDEKHEDIQEILDELEGKTFTTVDETKERICPVCGAEMIKNFVSTRKEIQVDDCYSCGGKFLDNGELQKIREQYESDVERTDDVMNFVYNNVGVELFELDEKVAQAQGSRSLLRKLFLKLWH